MTSTQIKLKCSCGSDQFEKPASPKATDTITCVRCGASGKYGEVMSKAMAQTKAAVEKQLKDTLRKAGFK